MKSKLPTKRDIKLFGEDLSGKSILLCRYLRPLKPPLEVCDLESNTRQFALEQCARFVSLLPFIGDLKHFKDLPDMYSNC